MIIEVKLKEGKREAFDKIFVGIFFFLKRVYGKTLNHPMSDIFKVFEKEDGTVEIISMLKSNQIGILNEIFIRFKGRGIIEDIEITKCTPSVKR